MNRLLASPAVLRAAFNLGRVVGWLTWHLMPKRLRLRLAQKMLAWADK